jgi:hypothetical protein
MFRRYLALLLVGPLLPLLSWAAPVAPKEPDSYHVRIRYQIFAFRTERVLQFREMTKAFEQAGFVRDADDEPEADEVENQNATRMRGVVPAKGLDRLVRQRHVRSVLAYPKGTTLPEKGAPVRVELRLASGYVLDIQRKLHAQSAKALAGVGFREAFGYDHRGYTRLVGGVPADALELLLADPRKIKGAKNVPAPFSAIGRIPLIVARPDWPVPVTRLPVSEVKDRKIALDLQARLGDAAATRLEVILGWTPADDDSSWRRTVSLPGVTIEGRLGPIVTVFGVPKDIAAKLAALDEVAHVRLPRPARVPEGAAKGSASTWKPLEASGVARLHAMGRRGKGTRLAIIGDDFSGWEKLKARDTAITSPEPTLLDLTAERNRTMLPDAQKGGESAATRCALLLQRAAPEAELTLIRIDPAAPYMLQEVARAINGQPVRTLTLDQRLQDISSDRVNLDERAAALTAERREVFRQVVDSDEWKRGRDEYQKRQEAYDLDAKAFEGRQTRYFALLLAMQKLKGIRVVASTLVWTEGYPVDGSSALSRYFDDRTFRCALWFQAAGDTNGQAWTGLFRDEDGNGFMEFAAQETRLAAGAWTPELNFLGWQAPGSDLANLTLPANARIRVSLQWREPHDSLPLRVGEDPYREPLAKMNLIVVAQPDADGKTRPSDDLEVVAQSGTFPTRLDQMRNAATYEHVVELKVPRAGRYAVMVEGKLPESVYAKGENRLPGQRKFGEIRPRLFVNTLEGTGRAVWTGFVSAQASLGMPADASAVITVAAADEKDRIRPASAAGAPLGMALRSKPDLLAYDEGNGTAEAASFAAGFVGSAWPTTGTVIGVLEGLRVRPGAVLRVPAARGK